MCRYRRQKPALFHPSLEMAKPRKKLDRLAFVASDVPEAQAARDRLTERYGNHAIAEADAVVALGGDGLMLQTLHRYINDRIPIYGMNRGSVGFLMNEYHEEGLLERIAAAEISRVHPLSMIAYDGAGKAHKGLAINEVSLFRETYQAAKLRITVDGKVRMQELICDGVLVATPAGSTAYNLSAYGPILPINAQLLALTPISPFRPRRWRGALLSNRASISISVIEHEKRPVAAVADHFEIRNIVRVDVSLAKHVELLMMYDADHSLEERILAEQFKY